MYFIGGCFQFIEIVLLLSSLLVDDSHQGVKFDPQTGSVLHIELARSNSRRKRKPGMYVCILCMHNQG